MKSIHHVVDIHAAAPAVYAALTTQEGLRGWWTTAVETSGAPGSVIEFTFVGPFNPDMEITRLDPGARVEWKCVGGHEPWQDSTFVFDVETADEHTRLRFWQHYAAELDDDSYGIYNFNWAYYLESLRLLVVEGEGKPYEPS